MESCKDRRGLVGGGRGVGKGARDGGGRGGEETEITHAASGITAL